MTLKSLTITISMTLSLWLSVSQFLSHRQCCCSYA